MGNSSLVLILRGQSRGLQRCFCLAQESYSFDLHFFIGGFAHVIDRQGRDGDGGEGFHLDTCLSDRGDRAHDMDGFALKLEFNLNFTEWKLVAEGDEMLRLFGCLDASDACDAEHVAFADLVAADEAERARCELDSSCSLGFASQWGLGGHIHHGRFSFAVDMCELWHGVLAADGDHAAVGLVVVAKIMFLGLASNDVLEKCCQGCVVAAVA